MKLNAILIATLFLLGQTAIYDSVRCQDVPSESELPLPDNAKWRFGQIGDTNSNGYYRLAYSPDGRYLASRNRINVVEVRDRKTKKLTCELAKHNARIQWMEFARDSKHLMTASTIDEPVRIWNIQSGKVVNEIDCEPRFVTFSQTGNSIFVLEKDRVLEYSWPECQFVSHRPIKANSENRPFVSRNAQFLIVSQRVNNKRVHLTKLLDLENDSSVVLPGPPKSPKRIAFSDDNVWAAATYTFEPRVRLWNLSNPSELSFTLGGHQQTVESLAFSKDNRFLATTGKDKKVVIWDLVTRQSVSTLKGHDAHVTSAAFAPFGFELATGASGLNDCTVIVWSLDKLLFPNAPKKIKSGQFPAAWNKLGSSSPLVALRQVNDLQFSAGEVFEQLKLEIGNPMITSHQEIASWIRQLDASTFKEREDAVAKLMGVRGQAERFLLEALDDAPSTEVRYRIGRILQHSATRPRINAAELRRLHRSIMLLELISKQPAHKEESIELLQAMAQNHPHLDISRDAASALTRINFSDNPDSEF